MAKFKKLTIKDFTITELLVVLAAIMLLMGVGAAAFVGGLSRQQADAAARVLGTRIVEARAVAVANSGLVAIAMPDDARGGISNPGYNRGYTSGFYTKKDREVFYGGSLLTNVEKTNKSDYNTRSLVKDEAWETPASGVASYIDTQVEKIGSVPIPSDYGSTGSAPGMIFRPGGSLTTAKKITIKVVAATYDADLGKLEYEKTPRSTYELENMGHTIIVNPYTGRAKFDRK